MNPAAGTAGWGRRARLARLALVACLALFAAGGAVAARSRTVATAQLSYVGDTKDKVGETAATPDRTPDGEFRLTLDATDTITEITLDTVDASAKPCCGQVWNTIPRDGLWLLGVFQGAKALNEVDINLAQPISGSVTYDLYADSSGYFTSGQGFGIYVHFASGACVAARTQIGGQSSSGGTCPANQPPESTAALWLESALVLRGKNGSRFNFYCPRGGTPGPVYGSDTYADSSSVCTAAVHDGVITQSTGGLVTIEIARGRSSYPSVTRNGVTSSTQLAWPGSFTFVGRSGGGGAGGAGGAGGGGSTTTTTSGGNATPPTATTTGTVTVNGRPFTSGTIPFSSTVDVTHGSVTLRASTGTLNVTGNNHLTAAFVLTRTTVNGQPATELRLAKGNFSVCPKRKTASASAAPATTVIRELWGNGKGKFQTRGRYAAASIRGTHWLTQDRCDGTLTKVTRGVVQVDDLHKHTTVLVRAGHSYLAKP